MKLKFPQQDNVSVLERLKSMIANLKLPSFSVLTSFINFSDTFSKNKDNPNNKNHLVIAAILIFILIGSIFIFSGNSAENVPKERVKIKIISGMDTSIIASKLKSTGVIDSPLKFRILAKINGYEDKLKVGNYTLETNMSYDDLFTKLLAGERETVNITIPEGFTVKEIAERLDYMNLVDKSEFLRKAKSFVPYDYVEKNDEAFYYCEGFLFPDTYNVESDVTTDEILNMMAENFEYRLTHSMRDRAYEENLSIYNLITLASLVEKEVRYAEDRPIVAQVFLKRLSLGMPLQTDASLQYLMDVPKEDVTIADTQINSPYNTYLNVGLPPGPIANPGIAAIEAVLYPADTDYLYFVADRSGHNHYSYTYDEHLNLVNQYR